MSKAKKRLIALLVAAIFATGAVIAANAITELTSDTATAEKAEERELQGPVWWALAPPAASVSGYPILATR